MKFSLVSDVHLEHQPEFRLKNVDESDVLILAGDILTAVVLEDKSDDLSRKNRNFHEFFQSVCSQWKHVIYVAGNHENYNFDITQTIDHLKKHLGYLTNLHILENEFVVIDDVVFVGSTMWTDMNKEDPQTLLQIKGMMNDFYCIKDPAVIHTDDWGQYAAAGRYDYIRPGIYTPEQSVHRFNKAKSYLKQVAENFQNRKVVVVTHHQPSYQSIHEKYRGDKHMNGGYASDLSEFMLDNPNIKYWCAGHVHSNFDYKIGGCNVLVNPKGYPGEHPPTREFKLLTKEV